MEKYKATSNGEVKSEEQRAIDNNSNNIRNLAEVAKNTPNPYVKAAGYAVSGLDKMTGGKSTELLSKVATKGIKNSPGGKTTQNMLNKASESGASNAIGSAAKAKSSGSTGGGAKAPSGGGNAPTGNKSSGNSSFMGSSGSKSSSSKMSNGDIAGSIWQMIPPAMKIKIYIGVGIGVIFMMMAFTVFADDDNKNLQLTNQSTMTSTSSSNINGTIDSSMYNGAGATMLNSGESLLSRLGQNKLDEINAQIVNDVDKAGRGTGAGVATAAYDFIKLLLDNGINMTYTYGGEHGTVKTGLQGNWGAGNGLDCSAFVSWALFNGGCTNHTQATVSGTQATYGVETTADKLKAGDIIANNEHVMLVIENTGSSVKVAHASSPTNGIIFSENTYDSLSKYSLRDMSSYYQQNCSS